MRVVSPPEVLRSHAGITRFFPARWAIENVRLLARPTPSVGAPLSGGMAAPAGEVGRRNWPVLETLACSNSERDRINAASEEVPFRRRNPDGSQISDE